MKTCLPNAIQVAHAKITCRRSNTNTLVRLEHEGWRPIKSDVQNTDINHAIYFDSKYYAIDEHNRLVIAPKFILEYFAGEQVVQIEKMGISLLFFVLKDRVIRVNTDNDIVEHFRGEVLELVTGNSHACLKTREGYFMSGSNASFEFGMEDLDEKIVREPIPAISLNKLPILQVYCGGWHCYAKLQDSTFLGWGYNRVCF
jgi:hypothetical protein